MPTSNISGMSRLLLSGTALAAAVLLSPAPAAAQDGRRLTGVVLRGAAAGVGGNAAASPAMPGVRIQSDRASWTELAFSDGTSVVLGPGAAFTLQATRREPGGRWVLSAAGGGGELRVVAADGMEVRLAMPGGTRVRIAAATAVVDARQGGRVTLLSGGAVTVTRVNGEEEVVRRPGFAITLDGGAGGPQRRSRDQIVASVEAFGAVRGGGGAGSGAAVGPDGAPNQNGLVRYGTQVAAVQPAQPAAVPNPATNPLTPTTPSSPVIAPPVSENPVVPVTPVVMPVIPVTPVDPVTPVVSPSPQPDPGMTTPVVDLPVTRKFASSVLSPGTSVDLGVSGPTNIQGSGSDLYGYGTLKPTEAQKVAVVLSAGASQNGNVFSFNIPNSVGYDVVDGPKEKNDPTRVTTPNVGATTGGASGLALLYCASPNCPTGAPGASSSPLLKAPAAYAIDGTTTSPSGLQTRSLTVGGIPAATLAGTQQLPGQPIASVARFTITDGLVGGLASFGPGQAALATGTGTLPALADSGLRVISDPTRRNPVMRAELQVAENGRSNAAVTVGGLYTQPNGSGQPSTLQLNARTVGSVQADTGSGPVGYVAVLSSPGYTGSSTLTLTNAVFSANAAGPGDGVPVGIFAVQNASAADGIRPVGGSAGPLNANTTLATATTPGTTPAAVARDALNLTGYATAVVNSTTGGGSQIYAVSTGANGVSITAPASTATSAGSGLSAGFGPFTATSVGSHALDTAPVAAPSGVMAPGGALTFADAANASGAPTTAVADATTFAAVGNGAAMASVNADMLATLRTTNPSLAAMVPSGTDVAWGYFLGDLANQADQKSGNYTNLGFWVAGQQVPLGVLQQLSGTATYTGGMIGTAVDTASAGRVIAGSFSQTWNFARQTTTGTMSATIDGAGWSGVPLSLRTGAADYAGSGMSTAGAARTLSVGGAFYGVGGPAVLPTATGGIFGIRSADGTYGANGIFVGRNK